MSLSYLITQHTSSSLVTGKITDRNFLLAALCTFPKIAHSKFYEDVINAVYKVAGSDDEVGI